MTGIDRRRGWLVATVVVGLLLGRAAGDFKQIFDDFRASYVLRYTPAGVSREGWHDLNVKVRAPDTSKMTIRARRGYWGSSP